MKKTFILIVIFCFVYLLTVPCLYAQTIYIQGTINNDTILNADTIKVTGEINILNGVTLSIIKGAYVEFQDYYTLHVHGRLIAIGDIIDTICFSVHDTTGFSDTSIVNGGWHGIHFDNTSTSNDTSKIIYCKLKYGKARGDTLPEYAGGAVYINNFSKVLISNSFICNNIASKYGGGIYCGENSSPIIEKCSFKNNRTYYCGGGLYIGANSNVKINGNIFIENIAYRKWLIYSSGNGGGICSSSGDLNAFCPLISNNRFFNNKAVSGGGIYESNYHIKVVNNLICNNEGSGIYIGHQLGQGIYVNNTISNNSMFGGIQCWSSYVDIVNNIIWGNTNWNASTTQINIFLSANPSVKYCNIQYGYGGEGNLDTIPLFIQPTIGAGLNFSGSEADWSLQNNSPCIDSGSPDTTGLSLPLMDNLGNPRISYNRIDIGAIEKQFPTVVEPGQFVISRIYPNPGTDYLIVESGPQISGANMIMTDIHGKQVLNKIIRESRIKVNTELISSGTYLWQIIYKDHVMETGKWIKQ